MRGASRKERGAMIDGPKASRAPEIRFARTLHIQRRRDFFGEIDSVSREPQNTIVARLTKLSSSFAHCKCPRRKNIPPSVQPNQDPSLHTTQRDNMDQA